MRELEPQFSQRRTAIRAQRLMLSGLLTMGRSWISRWISSTGRGGVDWSADYRVFSRSPWDAKRIFEPVVRHTLEMSKDRYLTIPFDETIVARSGKHVKAATWLRDPLSPHFHVNLKRGIRYLHFATAPHAGQIEGVPRRSFPIRFEMIQTVKKLKKEATEEELQTYREAKKKFNPSAMAVDAFEELRALYDKMGATDKTLVFVGDGSFCNRKTMSVVSERTILVARARKDAILCQRAVAGSNRIYDEKKFTPEDLRIDDNVPWQTASIFHGGMRRELRFKEIKDVLWQGGARRNPVRLFILAPTPYRLTKTGKIYYRNPAYLLTRNHDAPATTLIQSYVDRWEIEINHRDIKSTMGVGEAQVRNDSSVTRQPAFVVAAYSLLLVAAFKAYGPHRTVEYETLPKWRTRPPQRPSSIDVVTRLRREALLAREKIAKLGISLLDDSVIRKAAS